MSQNFDLDKEYKSTLVGKNITILGRRTSVRLEPEMWDILNEVAEREQTSIHELCSLIALRKKANASLTSSIRVFLLLYFRASSTNEGHTRARHGNFENMLTRARVDVDLKTGNKLPHAAKSETSSDEGNLRKFG